ncbi:hypothetical protein [Proteiniclasticum sp.]|uniref:hypothetical protein n=1 Tax=Proteiniclasticum sp. TaxID=2053595 RepID=UPI0028994157|nr:hypothetical protein [Proteiniclasticum sp.]
MAMTPESIKRMKELIEEKKQSGSQTKNTERPDKNKGMTRKAFKNKKNGGVFDK